MGRIFFRRRRRRLGEGPQGRLRTTGDDRGDDRRDRAHGVNILSLRRESRVAAPALGGRSCVFAEGFEAAGGRRKFDVGVDDCLQFCFSSCIEDGRRGIFF